MDQDQLDRYEKRLLEERRRVLEDLGQFDEQFAEDPRGSSGEPESYSFHMADEGTDAMEREKKFLFASQEGRRLYEVDAALRRLYRDPDAYGVCQECGREIAAERLDALPQVRLCIDCQQEEEESGGG